jgi:hypothetical protein
VVDKLVKLMDKRDTTYPTDPPMKRFITRKEEEEKEVSNSDAAKSRSGEFSSREDDSHFKRR